MMELEKKLNLLALLACYYVTIMSLYYLDLCNIKSLQNRLPLSSIVVLNKRTVTDLLNRHFRRSLLVLTFCPFSNAFAVNSMTDYQGEKNPKLE